MFGRIWAIRIRISSKLKILLGTNILLLILEGVCLFFEAFKDKRMNEYKVNFIIWSQKHMLQIPITFHVWTNPKSKHKTSSSPIFYLQIYVNNEMFTLTKGDQVYLHEFQWYNFILFFCEKLWWCMCQCKLWVLGYRNY